jgi:hypothetical protein
VSFSHPARAAVEARRLADKMVTMNKGRMPRLQKFKLLEWIP